MSNQTESKSRYQSESDCQGIDETNIIYRHLMWQEVNNNWQIDLIYEYEMNILIEKQKYLQFLK